MLPYEWSFAVAERVTVPPGPPAVVPEPPTVEMAPPVKKRWSPAPPMVSATFPPMPPAPALLASPLESRVPVRMIWLAEIEMVPALFPSASPSTLAVRMVPVTKTRPLGALSDRLTMVTGATPAG